MGVLKDLWRGVVEIVFPAERCPLCGCRFSPAGLGLFDGLICGACRMKIPFVSPPICSRCGKPLRGAEAAGAGAAGAKTAGTEAVGTEVAGAKVVATKAVGTKAAGAKAAGAEAAGGLCHDCRAFGRAFTVARAVGVYDGALREYIHDMKYRGKSLIGEALGMLMAGPVLHDRRLWASDMVVPVPMSGVRLAQRGFNQAEVLARGLGRMVGLDVVPEALSRIDEPAGPSRPQTKLRASARRHSLRGAFIARYPGLVVRRRVLLVDDVFTTGATADECALALLRAGALRVSVVTAAVGVADKFILDPGGTIHNASKSSIICVKNINGRGDL